MGGWPVWLANYFRFEPDAGAVMALTDSHNYRMALKQIFADVSFPDLDSIADALLANVMGMGLRSDILNGPCVMIQRKGVFEFGGFDPVLAADAIQGFGRKLLSRNRVIIHAIDVFCHE